MLSKAKSRKAGKNVKLKIKKLLATSGFTLIELMIVVAIIGLLTAIIVPKFASMKQRAAEGATRGALGTIRSNVEVYRGENINTPPTLLSNAALNAASPNLHPNTTNFWKGNATQFPQNESVIPKSRDVYNYRAAGAFIDDNVGTKINPGIAVANRKGWLYRNNDGSVFVNSVLPDIKNDPFSSW